ncbi:MAG: hypothetical protein HXS44_08610 [Theionarchaea archaeon]|nr:hypothetical protein [Theionarchaea archaeon]
MDEEETTLYYGIILACIVGIAITSLLLLHSTPAQEEFSELYLYFERIDLVEGRGTFRGCTIEVHTTVWIDVDKDGNRNEDETFLPGDTFVLEGEFWNISDVAKDGSQVLFGKFPKETNPGEINFTFVIVNHLQEDHAYKYTMAVNGTTKKETIYIKKEEREMIFQTLVVDVGNYQVIIALDTGEEIHFFFSSS